MPRRKIESEADENTDFEINETENMYAENGIDDIMIDDTTDTPEVINNGVVTSKPAKKKKYADSDIVTVKAVIPNVIYKSNKSNLYLKLVDIGDTQEITFGELKEIRASHRKFFTKPWIVVEDSDLRKEFAELRDGYNAFYQIDDISWIYRGTVSNAIANVEKIPQSLNEIFLSKVMDLIKKNKSIHLKVIKAIEKKLGVNLYDSIE